MSRIYLDGSDWRIKEFIGADWIWRGSVKPETSDVRWWYPAQVPGSVMYDMMQAGKISDPYFELNSKTAEWCSERTWVYRKEFTVSENDVKGKHIELCFEGVDYECEVYLNGKKLGRHIGMFTPFTYEISDLLLAGEKNLLAVVIESAPKEQPQVGRTSQVYTHKSRMTYWWDFCPRMIHQGIWKSVYLNVTDKVRFADCYFYTEVLEQEFAKINIEVRTEGIENALVRGRFGEEKFEIDIKKRYGNITLIIQNPKLWWPNGLGEAYEYEAELELYESDTDFCPSDCYYLKYGIRKIEFIQNQGCDNPAACYTLCINGRVQYMKGYNWVPADVMYGAVKAERIRHLVRMAKEAGIMMFRVWGGGLIETDTFYRACAENGILIWQEFIQSSSGIENKTPENDAYCEMMRKEAEIIIRLKRNETALAVWCGGNELQDKRGMPLDNDDRLLSILKQQVERLDKGRKWFPTSPSGGYFMNSMENILNHPKELFDVHGPWEHQGLREHCRLYNAGTSLMASEFGVEGMTNRWTQYKIMEESKMLPANKDNEIYFHRGAWWNNEPLVQEVFGENLTELEEIRKASQFLQYEGLKYAVECNMRRAMKNSASLPWQFNEPYPNLFCTSVVDYYGLPKPAYYGIKKIYGDCVVTASFDSPSLAGKDEFLADIFWSASNEKLESVRICAELRDLSGGLIAAEEWKNITAEINIHKKTGTIKCNLQDIDASLLLLRIQAFSGEIKVAVNEYLFTLEENFSAVYRQKAELLVNKTEKDIVLINKGPVIALFVYVSQKDGMPDEYVYLEDNYICLLPEERRRIRMDGRCGQIAVSALNTRGYTFEEE